MCVRVCVLHQAQHPACEVSPLECEHDDVSLGALEISVACMACVWPRGAGAREHADAHDLR